jgi:hypothetical protein
MLVGVVSVYLKPSAVVNSLILFLSLTRKTSRLSFIFRYNSTKSWIIFHIKKERSNLGTCSCFVTNFGVTVYTIFPFFSEKPLTSNWVGCATAVAVADRCHCSFSPGLRGAPPCRYST